MSREFYQAVSSMHQANASRFAANDDGKKRRVECRVDDCIYVYLIEDDVHIQTQHVAIPSRWDSRWPSDAAVRKHVRANADIGSVVITSLRA